MRKLLTAGIFGTILSLTGANYADASIISRGFFDEAMENYATNTALDLKANQSDFTELNTQISNSVDNLKTLWIPPVGDLAYGFDPNKVNNNINGAFGLVEGFILHSMLSLTGGWTDSRDNFYQGIKQLNDGWTDATDGTTYLGVKSLNDELLWPIKSFTFESSSEAELFGLRTLDTYPNGTTVKDVLLNMFQSQSSDYYNGNYPKFGVVGERIFNGGKVAIPEQAFYSSFNATKAPLYTLDTYDGLFGLNAKTGSYYWGPENDRYKFSNIPYFEELFPSTSPDKSIAMTDMATTILSNYTDPGFPGLAGVTNRLLNGWTDAKGVLANPGLKGIYDGWVGRNGLHNLGLVETVELDSFWLYNPENDSPQLLKGQRGGLLYVLNSLLTFNDGFTSSEGGLAPFWKLTQSAYKTEELYTKIGDLPTEIPNVDSIWDRYGFVENRGTPIDLPDTIGGMFAMLFNEDGSNNVLSLRNIMARILMGINLPTGGRIEGLANLNTAYNLFGDSPIVTAVNANTAKIGTVPDGKNLAGMISETDAKIGSWNAGYIADGTNNPLFNVWEKYLPQFTNMFQEIYLSRPTSLADLIDKLYGIRVDDSGDWGILGNIGALIDTVGLTTDAIRSKIGTLPTGYDNVGAALTAMKSDIDAKNLPSTSDDGQYVLTAKKVGDTITYTWVKMDLTNEEQAQ